MGQDLRNVGALIRNHRKARELTLRVVAERAGISEGFLSQVENNVKLPSLDKLYRICEALDLEAGDLLNQAARRRSLFVVRQTEWDQVDTPHTGFATLRFRPAEELSVFDSQVLFLEPGAGLPVRKGFRNGQEVLCVLEGSLELDHPERKIILEKGDAVHMLSEPKGQAIINRGETRAIVLWVGTI